jgi:hypothetical protein
MFCQGEHENWVHDALTRHGESKPGSSSEAVYISPCVRVQLCFLSVLFVRNQGQLDICNLIVEFFF